MTLAVSIFIVDILGRKRFTKLGIVFGSNAITMYVYQSDDMVLLFHENR